MHNAIYVMTNVVFLLFWATGMVCCTRFALRRGRALAAVVRRRRRTVEWS